MASDHLCNRKACRAPGARWWHRVMAAYYCGYCKLLIERANPGKDWFTLEADDGE